MPDINWRAALCEHCRNGIEVYHLEPGYHVAQRDEDGPIRCQAPSPDVHIAALAARVGELEDEDARLRIGLAKQNMQLAGWMNMKNGSDWRTRMPLWRDKMSSVEIFIMDLALEGEALLVASALSPEGPSTTEEPEPETECACSRIDVDLDDNSHCPVHG